MTTPPERIEEKQKVLTSTACCRACFRQRKQLTDEIIKELEQTHHQELQKARHEVKDMIKEFLPIMRECKSGCGCRYEGEGHEGGCVWQPKEYYEAHELEPLFKAIQSELDQPTV